MKAVFTCDEVFDTLTREPFPSGGENDEVVESHLAVCHECRQLAEVFRPAVGLFHESLAAGFDESLPMYRGRLKPIIDSLPQMSLDAPRKDVWTHRSLAIAASLLVVGAVILAVLAAIQRVDGIAPAARQVRVHDNRDYTLLAALEIPASCRAVRQAGNLMAAAEMACCTKCHNADSRVASTEKAILKSSAACVACHDGRLDEAISALEYDRVRTRFRDKFDVIYVRLAGDGSTDAVRHAALSYLLGSVVSSMGV